MSTPTIDILQKQLTKASDWIDGLERNIQNIRPKTNSPLQGNAAIIDVLVSQTGCQPARGPYFSFGTNIDVRHN